MWKPMSAVAIAALLISSGGASAQSNLEKLSNFKSTGAKTIPQVDQGGANAEAIRNNLKKIKLPDGFKIELYAIVPDARDIAVGPQGVVTFVSTRKDKVYSVTDRNKDRVADDVREFAPSLEKTIPHGVCFSKDGFLFIAEQNRVVVYPAAEYFYEGPDVAAFKVVGQGELIPVDEESYNHTARICRVGISRQSAARRSRSGVRRGAVELPHADVSCARFEQGIRRRQLRRHRGRASGEKCERQAGSYACGTASEDRVQRRQATDAGRSRLAARQSASRVLHRQFGDD